jgi:hypothetical protein
MHAVTFVVGMVGSRLPVLLSVNVVVVLSLLAVIRVFVVTVALGRRVLHAVLGVLAVVPAVLLRVGLPVHGVTGSAAVRGALPARLVAGGLDCGLLSLNGPGGRVRALRVEVREVSPRGPERGQDLLGSAGMSAGAG